ncbi:MAG TPA: DEAD/DEAH box helicase family protein [Mollicutes bacterium]|nr:DEAD/DEAH box helicase family protein [Mollicutes bacterium]
MQGISLKDFQIKTVNKLLDYTTVGDRKEVLLQAPTGSGKTIILLSYIEEYLEENKNTVFVWLTPGRGDLEEQSNKKMRKFLPNHSTKFIQDVLLQGFDAKDTAFINWETITKKGNNALKETERKNLFERISEAHNKGLKFIAIVDEEHVNKTIKAEAIIEYLEPEYIVRVSATTKTNKEAAFIEVNELDVIAEGLITRALYINEGVSNQDILTNEHEYLIDLALTKRKNIRNEYIKRDLRINPLIIIQVPNKSDDLIKQIEKILESKEYTYNHGNLAIWLSDRKENIEDIEANFAQPVILIMKQAISTGWDCPRAKILVKLRENMSEDFETQTLGRIRRMPEAHHYDNVLLDNCYLYTFDEKYEETVRQELGNNASDSKVIFLKNEYKDFSLIKEIANSEFDGFDDRETFRILHQYFIDKYNLTTNKKNNQVILESHGYKFKDTIESNIVQDKIIKLHSSELESANRIKVESSVTTSKNGFELRYSIGMISSRIGIRYDRTRLMLERMFLKSKLFTKKFVNLSIIEFYAFVINNESLLKHDFHEAVSQKARQQKMDLEEVKAVKWGFPQQNYIKYDKTMKDTEIYNKNVYIEYPNSTIKSTSERLFEHFCENNENIKWFYKNGDKAAEYFSIVYVDAINKRWHFYPDYILCDHKNNIWIIETKGGESISGQSKNIDIKVENKFEALKKYATEHNINFGIVRDYDKNGWLYLCNTEYTDDMGNDNWVLLKDIFND